MSLLELVDVAKTASLRRGRELTVLRHVNLRIDAGERVAVLGRSGSGKSTLLSILGLLDMPTAGKYTVAGEDTGRLGARRLAELRGRTFGFVYQRFCLMAHLTAVENVEAAALHRGEPRAARRERALAALERVGLADRAGHRPGQLSGGEQQRVAIARALAGEPLILLADEPTGALDEDTGARVMDQLHTLAAEQGATLIVVTHDPVVAAACDRSVSLHQGRLADTAVST